MTPVQPSLVARITALLDHLGIQRVHVAARMLSDWQGFAAQHPTRIASLSLVCPPNIEPQVLAPLADRLYLITGEQSPSNPQVAQVMQQFPEAVYQILPGVSTLLWTDIARDFMDELQTTMLPFIVNRRGTALMATTLKDGDRGEVAGITYTVYGVGEPLFLFPLILAPSGWVPLLNSLSKQFCVIVLGGPELGALPVLEQRGQTVGYQRMVRNLFDAIQPRTGETILEVGSGSGVICRWLAQRTNGNNLITGVDISDYLLDEARVLAEKEQVADHLHFCNGNAEALPFPNNHFDITFSATVMEEVDADKMLAEMIRVTKPGGRVGVIVRAEDLPFAINIPVRSDLRARFETLPPLDEGAACASASLYQRFHQSLLTNIIGWPQLVEFTKSTGIVEHFLMIATVTEFTTAEREEWYNAIAQAVANNTFFITWPHHCAVGTKPEMQP